MADLRTIFENFRGNWIFEREMNSLQGERQGKGVGIAVFSDGANENEIHYHEEGDAVYYPSEAEIPFFRDYRYVLNENNIALYHASGPQNGELYQEYTTNKTATLLSAVAVHVCADDLYKGLYQLTDTVRFTLTTEIKGPLKNSLITTYFQRSPK